MSDSKTLSLADISMLALASKIVLDRGLAVYSFSTAGIVEGYHVTREAIRSIMDETSAEPRISRRKSTDIPWEADIEYGGARFRAIFTTEELKIIGYHIPIAQPATAPEPIKTEAGVA